MNYTVDVPRRQPRPPLRCLESRTNPSYRICVVCHWARGYLFHVLHKLESVPNASCFSDRGHCCIPQWKPCIERGTRATTSWVAVSVVFLTEGAVVAAGMSLDEPGYHVTYILADLKYRPNSRIKMYFYHETCLFPF